MRRESNARVTDDNWPVLPETLITGESASHYVALRTSKLGYIHITASRYSDDRSPRSIRQIRLGVAAAGARMGLAGTNRHRAAYHAAILKGDL